MPEVFADTFYWIALLNPADHWHQAAKNFTQTHSEVILVTTDEGLTEILNYFSAGDRTRQAVVSLCEQLMVNVKTVVLPQTRMVFKRGFDLYKARPDKRYSLTDCISMIEMSDRKISDVLTHDRHFAQEGFNPLFR